MKTNFNRTKWFPVFIFAIILMIIYYALGNLPQITSEIGRFFRVISPLFYGILFSYFLFIPHQFIERLIRKIKIKFISKRARVFATIIVFLLLVLIIVLVISFVIPVILSSLIELANSVQGYVIFITDFILGVSEDTFWASFNIIDNLTENAGSMITQVLNAGMIESFAVGIINFAGELLNLVLGMFISLYLLLDRERIVGFFKKLSFAVFKKPKARTLVQKYMNLINKVLFTFIASKGLDSIINIIAVTTILLVFDVPYAVLFGIMAGVLNFIPYLGSLIAVIIITLITMITGGFAQAIQVLIPLFIFQQIDGNFIEPRIMKSSLKISPILVIIAVVAGGAYFGAVGMFLAVPLAVVLKLMLIEYVTHAENPVYEEYEDPDPTTAND